MRVPPDPARYSLLFDVFVLGQRVAELLRTAMAGAQLRPQEYAVYSVVFEEEVVSPSEMAAQLSMPLTTVVDHLRVMLQRGHARRLTNPDDGRSYLVTLTAEGLAAHREANRKFSVAYERLVAELPSGEERARAQLAEIMAATERAVEGVRR